MATFDFLKSYRLNSKDVTPSADSKHVFYPVAIKDIIESESRLGFLFPDELDEFYKEVGYGFLNHRDKRGNFNRFLPPASVADINLRVDPYENDPDLEVYDDPTKLIFFELTSRATGGSCKVAPGPQACAPDDGARGRRPGRAPGGGRHGAGHARAPLLGQRRLDSCWRPGQGRRITEIIDKPVQAESGWLRVTTPYSGDGKGHLFTPEVGSQVLVNYEHGLPEFPVVVGNVFHPGTAVELGFKGDGSITIKSNGPVTVLSPTIALEAGEKGEINLHAKNITIKAEENLKLLSGLKTEASTEEMEIYATQKLSLEGSTTATLTSAQPAAALGDVAAHGGAIVIGSPNVFIGGRPAARQGDSVACPFHGMGVVSRGSATVFINGTPAARLLDTTGCLVAGLVAISIPSVLGPAPAAAPAAPAPAGAPPIEWAGSFAPEKNGKFYEQNDKEPGGVSALHAEGHVTDADKDGTYDT
nr:hypothetical protein [Tanacetum cinerariifolium]